MESAQLAAAAVLSNDFKQLRGLIAAYPELVQPLPEPIWIRLRDSHKERTETTNMLTLAIEHGRPQVLEMLVHAGGDPNAVLGAAIRARDADCVAVLTASGGCATFAAMVDPDVDFNLAESYSLSGALRRGDLAAAEAHFATGCPLNVADRHDVTPLVYAAEAGEDDLAIRMLEYEALAFADWENSAWTVRPETEAAAMRLVEHASDAVLERALAAGDTTLPEEALEVALIHGGPERARLVLGHERSPLHRATASAEIAPILARLAPAASQETLLPLLQATPAWAVRAHADEMFKALVRRNPEMAGYFLDKLGVEAMSPEALIDAVRVAVETANLPLLGVALKGLRKVMPRFDEATEKAVYGALAKARDLGLIETAIQAGLDPVDSGLLKTALGRVPGSAVRVDPEDLAAFGRIFDACRDEPARLTRLAPDVAARGQGALLARLAQSACTGPLKLYPDACVRLADACLSHPEPLARVLGHVTLDPDWHAAAVQRVLTEPALQTQLGEVIEVLAAHGLDARGATIDGSALLEHVVRLPNVVARRGAARALLAAGADPNGFNDEGESVLGLAVEQSDPVLVEILEKAGARANVAMAMGDFDLAAYQRLTGVKKSARPSRGPGL
jgi:ankyrin repeat protein